jgi:hypothetical protein
VISSCAVQSLPGLGTIPVSRLGICAALSGIGGVDGESLPDQGPCGLRGFVLTHFAPSRGGIDMHQEMCRLLSRAPDGAKRREMACRSVTTQGRFSFESFECVGVSLIILGVGLRRCRTENNLSTCI